MSREADRGGPREDERRRRRPDCDVAAGTGNEPAVVHAEDHPHAEAMLSEDDSESPCDEAPHTKRRRG